MKRKDRETGVEEKVESERPKKEFKIEIVKVGKLEENTTVPGCECYACNDEPG